VEVDMVGRTRLSVTEEERAALEQLARSAERAEADRARAILWSSEGRTGAVIGGLLGVQADTVRQWRRRFRAGGVAALRTRPKPGKAPWKSRAALAVIEELLALPLAQRPNWTLPRLQRAVRERAGISLSPSRLSVVMRQKGISVAADRATRCRSGRTPRPSTGPGCG
jgi:transposase